jgi:hypothetical protein
VSTNGWPYPNPTSSGLVAFTASRWGENDLYARLMAEPDRSPSRARHPSNVMDLPCGGPRLVALPGGGEHVESDPPELVVFHAEDVPDE